MSVRNAIIDCRVSSQKQSTGGGLAEQERACNYFVQMKGWNVVRTFSKIYSGRAEEREDFEAIISFIKEHSFTEEKIHYYVVKSIDRFTRDGAVTYEEMKDRLEHLGIQLIDTYGIIQPIQNTLAHHGFEYAWSKRSPTATAQLMEAQRARDEVSDILTRMIGASIQAVKDGYKVRQANDGFVNEKVYIDGKKRVVERPDPARAHYFAKMFALRAEGVEDPEIVNLINAMGFRTKQGQRWNREKTKVIGGTGGCLLTVKQLQRYIQRPIYAGVRVEKWTHFQPVPAQYPGLVSIETFNRANRGKVYIEKNQAGSLRLLYNHSPFGKIAAKRHRHNPNYIWKFVRCNVCGRPLLASAPRSKSGKHSPRYHCGGTPTRQHPSYSIPQKQFEDTVKRYLDHLQFQDGFLASLEYVLVQKYRKREKEVVSEAAHVNQNVANLKTEQASKLEAYEASRSETVRRKLEDQIEALETQIKRAVGTRNDVEVTEHGIKSFIQYAKYTMEHPSEMLTRLDDWRARQAILGLIFEEMPTYQEILSGTPKLTAVFKLSERFKMGKTQRVSALGLGWNTLVSMVRNWNAVFESFDLHNNRSNKKNPLRIEPASGLFFAVDL